MTEESLFDGTKASLHSIMWLLVTNYRVDKVSELSITWNWKAYYHVKDEEKILHLQIMKTTEHHNCSVKMMQIHYIISENITDKFCYPSN